MRTNDENGTRREAVPHPARLPAWEGRLLAQKGTPRRSSASRPPAVLGGNAAVSTDRANFDAVNQAARANLAARKPGLRTDASIR